ncbi:MAG TPA: outer membrane protein transport protein [Burkholderiales bacterium]|nr:outer membrane protein transport protein [Burkholderiales bacterium]
MKFHNKIMKLCISSAVAAGSLAAALPACGGGFGIATQSGSGTGNAYAGGAAAADDASVAWSNPAAMTALPTGTQVTFALHAVRPSFKFTNGGSTGAFNLPGAFDSSDGGSWNFIPNGYLVTTLTPSWRFGLALNVPFGLKTDYDLGWRGAPQALKSEIKTVNINPSAAYKISDSFSIGFGVSAQKIEAELSSAAGAAGIASLSADDWGYGFNIGATFQPSAATRIGLHYRSTIKYNLSGSATFSSIGALNGGITADLKVPDSTSLSVFHELNSSWDLMGDITYTGWDSVQQLTVIRTTPSAGGAAGSVLTNLPFLWDNTWRFAVGTNYRVNDSTKLRFGVAHDQSPTNDATRTPRLPDQARTWLALGVQFKPSKQGALEVAYAHEFIRDAAINVGAPPAPGTLVGTFKNKADIISIQYSHAF